MSMLAAVGKQDGYLLGTSSASISSIGLCASSTDKFVSHAASAVFANYNSQGNFTWAMVNDAAMLLGHEAISSNTSTLTSQLLNVVSLSR